MATGALVVVSVPRTDVAAMQAELARQGAQGVSTHRRGSAYMLLCGHFSDDITVHRVVMTLRQQEWAAAARPADDDPHLVARRNRTRPVGIGDGRSNPFFFQFRNPHSAIRISRPLSAAM